MIIVTPWIRGNESKRFVNDIVSALERGVKVTVVYGNKCSNENDNNDAEVEQILQQLFSGYTNSCSGLIRLGTKNYIESRGTNERILVCDSKFVVIGSWNWLSHSYRDYCNKHRENRKAQIRQEISIKISEELSISEIKARISQYFR